jgi:alpha-L-rhamnosidase
MMKPMPVGDLTSIKASHESPYGHIESDWHTDGKTFSWHITVPPNSTATVFVPASSANSVIESSHPAANRPGINFLRDEPGRAVYQLDSGTYDFQSSTN